MKANAPIGIMDSGMGGLSVVLALQKDLPNEDIIYFGDTANLPYGNKTVEQIVDLSNNMISFLEKKGVKCVGIACNTISAQAAQLRPSHDITIITVSECGADAFGRMGINDIGLIATVATVDSGIYEKRICAVNPNAKVIGEGSVHLARLVEENHPTTDAVDTEIKECMERLLAKGDVSHVILGCTHYPLVADRFKAACPDIEFVDPAPHQVACIKEFLAENDALNQSRKPKLTVYTSGDTAGFKDMCSKTGLCDHYDAEFIHVDN